MPVLDRTSDFFGCKFVSFWEMFFKKNLLGQVSCFLKINISKKILKKKFTATAYNMKGCFRFVYFHILNITKFAWRLNIRMNDCHLHNTKTEGKKKTKTVDWKPLRFPQLQYITKMIYVDAGTRGYSSRRLGINHPSKKEHNKHSRRLARWFLCVCVCVCCVRTVLPCLFPELVFFSFLLLLLLRPSRVSAGTISSRRYLQQQQQQYRAGRFRQLREYFRLYWYWSCCGK